MIKVENVSKSYYVGKNEIKALNSVTIQFDNNQFYSVMGKSGSGKTTLLNILGGLDRPDSGKVIIDNSNICMLDEKKLSVFRRKNIGFVFQFFNLLPELNVRENIMFPVLLNKSKIDIDIDNDYYNQIISTLNLDSHISHLPYQLSGGQLQRVAIARALILKPQILLLDEPTGNLDYDTSLQTMDMLVELKNELKQTVVMVTHDLEMSSYADKTIKIQDGKVYENG